MITLENVNLRFGEKIVFSNFSQKFEEGKINCVMGPSGCGKTTLLNLLADIVKEDEGCVDKPDTVSYVFQEDLLIPQKTARQNLDLILQGINSCKRARYEIIDKLFALSGLKGAEDLYPHEMSGGMKQRLALIRAFAFRSEVMLMDEPFKALDITLKDSIIKVFFSLYEEYRPTVILVTHDIDDVLLTGDCAYIYNKSMSLQKKFHIDGDKRGRKLYDDMLVAIKNEIYLETEEWLRR